MTMILIIAALVATVVTVATVVHHLQITTHLAVHIIWGVHYLRMKIRLWVLIETAIKKRNDLCTSIMKSMKTLKEKKSA